MKLIVSRNGNEFNNRVAFFYYSNYLLCRGEKFRTAFSNLGQVRSIVPCSVGVMALRWRLPIENNACMN